MLFRFLVLLLIACGTCHGGIIVSEFLADNVTGLKDEDDSRQDWIELYNTGAETVSLSGWWLSDDATNKAKWMFPNVSIAPGGTVFVWASGKNRRVVGQPLHTNFSLAKAGEYLGLHKPGQTQGSVELVDEYAPNFPAQATDVSYGRNFSQSTATLIASGAVGRYKVLGNNATGQSQYSGTNYAGGDVGTGQSGGWNVNPAFDDSAWTAAATGIGYDTGGGLLSLLGASPTGNCQTALRNVNPSLLFRATFSVANPSQYSTYKLRMKYEDGFVAFVNGTQVGQANNPATLTYNSTAPVALDETIVNSWTEFTIPANLIQAGTNLLAIQGLNSSVSSSDFLLLPEIQAGTGLVVGAPVYFSTPTPAAANGAGTSGPVVFSPLPADPNVPRPTGNASSPPLAVSVRAMKTQYNLTAVRAYYRIMYNAESSALIMFDNGVSPDLVAGDGIYTVNIPTAGVGAAQMLRWRFEVSDLNGNVTKLPAYLSTTDSPQYFGTVAQSTLAANSQLPVMEWFVENAPATGPTAAAFRGCMYYLGYFYDNIGHEIHGQSTAGLAKKSYDFDSNTGYRFLWKEGEGKVKDLNLLSNFADKTKTRNSLSHEVGMTMGAPYHFCSPVRVHLNGSFHGVMDLMEDGDDRMLERNGLDPEGAFYKIYSETMNVSAEKKTRLTEANTDLNTLTTSLDPALALATRRAWGYDNIDIAATVNYLVLRQLNSDGDHGHKNYYLYRDTNRTGEWLPIVWDVDLSQGHQWNGNNGTLGYFNDTLVTNNALNRHSSANRLYNLILESPEFQEMFARRMRTAMDTIMQPPGTVNGWFETRMRAIAASVDPDPANPSPLTDGDLDRAKWGMNSNFIDNKPREEVERVVSGYYGPRRSFLFDQTSTRPLVQKPGLTGGTPVPDYPQAAGAGSVVVDSIDYYPGSSSQAAEYIILRNTTAQAIDLTGWRLAGAVAHNFTAGTVIPAGAGTAAVEYKGLLHVVKDAVAFRARTTGPRGGEKRFIQGNYTGQLSSRGETIQLYDQNNALITSFAYAGSATAAQQFLRVSEIHYNPLPPTPAESAQVAGLNNDDFEFIELVNNGSSAINLTGFRFTAGVDFTFPAASIPAGGRVIISRRPEAFLLRHPGFTGVLGPYEGALDNGGERIELTEASGEVVLDFTYDDIWRPVTDGAGYSLVLRQPNTSADLMGDPSSWLMSPTLDGSPGAGDVFATISLENLAAVYSGSGIAATVVTTPAGLPVAVTYDGSATLPVNAGSYAVSAVITAPNYEGAANGTLVIDKAPQTITFGTLADIPLDGGIHHLTASSDGGLPVSFEVVSGLAVLAGQTLTPNASGVVVVRASQAGDGNHHAATPVDRSFAVTRTYTDSAWRTGSFDTYQLADPMVSGPNADPDGDGLPNLIEYALATDPMAREPAKAPHVAQVTHESVIYQSIRFRRRIANPEIELRPEISTDLGDWNHGSPDLEMLGEPEPNGDGTETVTYRSTVPAHTRQSEFLRLHAVIAP